MTASELFVRCARLLKENEKEQAFRVTAGLRSASRVQKSEGTVMTPTPCTTLSTQEITQLPQDSIRSDLPILFPGRGVEPKKYPNHEVQRGIRRCVKDEASFGISNPEE